MLHNHIATKFVSAGVLAGVLSVQQLAAAMGVELDAGHLVTILMAGGMGLIMTLIGSAWRDIRAALKEARRDRESLRRRLDELESFRLRATWVCPLMDAGSSIQARRKHVEELRERLDRED